MRIAAVAVLCCLFVAGTADKKTGPKVTDMVRCLIFIIDTSLAWFFTTPSQILE